MKKNLKVSCVLFIIAAVLEFFVFVMDYISETVDKDYSSLILGCVFLIGAITIFIKYKRENK